MVLENEGINIAAAGFINPNPWTLQLVCIQRTVLQDSPRASLSDSVDSLRDGWEGQTELFGTNKEKRRRGREEEIQ